MRRIVVLVIFLLFSVSILSAQETSAMSASKKWSGSFSSTVGNRYVGSTVCAIFANQTVIQSEVDLTHTDKSTTFIMTAWNSTGVTRSTAFETYAYETDVDLNISHRFGKYKMSVGGWMFFLTPKAKTNVPVGDLKISRDFTSGKNFFTPFTEVQWYGTTNPVDAGYHGGVYPMVGVTYSRPVSERVTFSLQVHTNYDLSGGFGKTQGKTMLAADTSLRVSIVKSLVAFAHAGIVGSPNDPGRPWVPVFNIGISRSF